MVIHKGVSWNVPYVTLDTENKYNHRLENSIAKALNSIAKGKKIFTCGAIFRDRHFCG